VPAGLFRSAVNPSGIRWNDLRLSPNSEVAGTPALAAWGFSCFGSSRRMVTVFLPNRWTPPQAPEKSGGPEVAIVWWPATATI
jgi:hypothetical protein